MADEKRTPAPVTSSQAREDQLISMAYDAVEQRIKDGTATGPELVHFLRMGSPKTKLEREILEKEKELITAKTEAIHTQKDLKELYANAITALQSYGGGSSDE